MRRVSAVKFFAMSIALAVIGAASLFAWTGDPAAASAKEKPETASLGGEVHIQLAPFMAPVRLEGRGSSFREPVTLVLKIQAEAAPTVCRLTPRIYDAVLRELHRKPIPADRRKKLLVKTVEGRLAGPVSRALEGTEIQRVYLLIGAHPKNVAKDIARRLPMTEIVNCGPVDAT